MSNSFSPAANVPEPWVELLRLVPGYDPFAGAAAAGCWFEPEDAQEAIDFFPTALTHIEGDKAGEPFELEPWQKAIVGNLFGWMKKDARGRVVRRYREMLLYTPRKTGKTIMAGGIGLLVFFMDDEAGQQDRDPIY